MIKYSVKKRYVLAMLSFLTLCLIFFIPPLVDGFLVYFNKNPLFPNNVDVYWDGGSAICEGWYYTIHDGRMSYSSNNCYFQVEIMQVTVFKKSYTPRPTRPPSNHGNPF